MQIEIFMKFIVDLLRLLVGILFIISGLIKANDPMGFGFKLEEYFEVFGMPFFNPIATPLAIGICIFEIVLGFMLLIGAKKKPTLYWLLAMIVFFTFLTFYSAYFNKVTDCGCFGDALKLTPWQSFTKDVVLLLALLILFAGQKFIRPLFWPKTENRLLFAISLVTTIFSLYCWYYLPVKDFRAYKVGNNLPSLMTIPDDAPQPVYETQLIYEKDGVSQTFTMQNYPWDDSTWVWKETKNVLISKGYEPPIHDFTMTDYTGNNVLPDVLEMPFVLLVISKKFEETNAAQWQQLQPIKQWAQTNGIEMMALTATSPGLARGFAQMRGVQMPFYFTDATTLKTIIRSNPGLLMLKKGTVLANWPSTKLPNVAQLDALTQK